MEEIYSRLGAAMPKYERAGVPHLPFDAQGVLYAAAMANLGSQENWAGGSTQ